MASITKTINAVVYEFKEVNTETQWELEEEVEKNKYRLILCKFGEIWCGTVKIETHDGASMEFQQKNLASWEILVRRLVDYSTRVQQLMKPMPKDMADS